MADRLEVLLGHLEEHPAEVVGDQLAHRRQQHPEGVHEPVRLLRLGQVGRAQRLADGRYDIVLRGLERFRVLEEEHSKSYRRAIVEPLREPPPASEDRQIIRNCRSKLEAMLVPAVEKAGADARMPAAMSDEDLVNALAQYLDLEPLEKQALLEQRGLRSRAQSLVELLEMKMLASKVPRGSSVAH